MALLDAYATAAEYKSRVSKIGAADDSEILAQLEAISRYIERATQRNFNLSASAVRYFDGDGDSRLWIDDLVTLSAAAVDDDGDGTYELALTLSNVRTLPLNAAERSEPFTSLELARYTANNQLSAWSRGRASVKLTALWGWPSVPDAIREATVLLCRELRDLQESGPTLTLGSIDSAIRISPRAAGIVTDLVSTYHRAGVASV